MSKRNRAVVWGTLAVILLIVLAFVPSTNGKRPKAQPQRISTVNSVRSVSITLPATNVPSPSQPGNAR